MLYLLKNGPLGTWQTITPGEYEALAAEIEEHRARGALHKLNGLTIAKIDP